jgi:hypothetical protein
MWIGDRVSYETHTLYSQSNVKQEEELVADKAYNTHRGMWNRRQSCRWTWWRVFSSSGTP